MDNIVKLTLYLQVSSADAFRKQIGPRSGPTSRRAWSGSNQFHTQMVFLKEFLKKLNFKKNATLLFYFLSYRQRRPS